MTQAAPAFGVRRLLDEYESSEWLVLHWSLDPSPARPRRAHWYPAGILPTAACGYTANLAAVWAGPSTDPFAESIRETVVWTQRVDEDRCARCEKRAAS